MPPTILKNATSVSGRPIDVRIDAGVIVDIGNGGSLACDRSSHDDLSGWLLLPAPVEPHAHLDKAFLAETIDNPTGDLHGAIDVMSTPESVRDVDDIVERSTRAARQLACNGFVAVRTHVDVSPTAGTRHVEAMLQVREAVADLIDVEIVALAAPGLCESRTGQLSRLRDAMATGADLVGGCPHLETSSRQATALLLDLATEYDVGVDLHTDECLDPAASGLEELAEAVEAGFGLPATASHCVSLGQRSISDQHDLADRLAAVEISVVILPHTNLYLQGRGEPTTPRGIAPALLLAEHGVNVAAGADNLQDPFNPLGRGCPFETAGLAVLAAHVLPGDAWTMVSQAAARALGRVAGLAIGKPADLLAVRAGSIRQAIAEAPVRRRWKAGIEGTVVAQ